MRIISSAAVRIVPQAIMSETWCNEHVGTGGCGEGGNGFRMKVTYIAHSGFLVETERYLFLFDYYKGEIPELSEAKPLYVFVSHRHEDHFNPEIFQLAKKRRQVYFILSYDIRLTPRNLKKWGIDESWLQRTISVKAHETCYPEAKFGGAENGLKVETLKSTDEGVAFLLTEGDHTIYHAGDLNWWLWNGEDKGWLGTMTANFKREVERIAGREIDLAFLPLDDRQEEWFYKGMDWFLRSCRVRYAFPMHFWEDSSVVKRFEALDCRKDYDTVICDTAHERCWEI